MAKSSLQVPAHTNLELERALADNCGEKKSCQQHGSLEIQRGKVLNRESSGDTEEKVTMCVTNKGSQTLNAISSDEQVDNDVENSAKIVITHVENYESITAHNDV